MSLTGDDLLTSQIKPKESLEKEVQTEVEYPTMVEAEIKEVIRRVEVPVEIEKEIIKEIVREIHVKEDSEKIDDTDISTDENGRFRIFEQVSNPDDPETEDSLTGEFTQRTKIS